MCLPFLNLSVRYDAYDVAYVGDASDSILTDTGDSRSPIPGP
jgi:hypothetical protein